MKMPDRCPICNGIMLIDYKNNKKKEFYKKSCTQINHDICYVICPDDTVDRVSIYVNRQISVYWFTPPNEQTVVVTKGSKIDNSLYLPYFEPDFSNYKQLIEKIKTYIVFS